MYELLIRAYREKMEEIGLELHGNQCLYASFVWESCDYGLCDVSIDYQCTKIIELFGCIWRPCRRWERQCSSRAFVARAQYSTSKEDQEIIVCFLNS